MFRTLWLSLTCSVVVAFGCRKEPTPEVDLSTASQRAAVKLNILVIDDEKLAAGIRLLRGEWSERSGGELIVDEMSSVELLAAERLAADLVIYPSRYVGTLVAREWLRPIRDTLLTNSSFGFSDLLPLIRNRSIRYGGEIYSLSLGSPPLMISCPADALPEGGISPWESFQANLSVRSLRLRHRWATELLVRGVAYAPLKSDAAVLFDPQSMEPRIEEPPFAKALAEMFFIHRSESPADHDFQLGIGWPTSHSYHSSGEAAAAIEFLALPKAREVYRTSRKSWEANEAAVAPTMLGFAGRSASVLRASRNSASAFKLLVWLVSGDPAIQLSQRSKATVWFRSSQVSQAQKWLAGQNAGEGAAAEVTALLSSEHCFLLPRIPGIDDYLQALDHEIEQAVATEKSSTEVLAAAAEKWQAITTRLGTQKQRTAYRQHLGFADSPE